MHRPFVLLTSCVLLVPAALAQTFAPAVTLNSGQSPERSAAFDADADGDVDLVVANGDSSFLSYFRNVGGLTTATNVAVGGDAEGLIAADLDGDGDLDLAAALGNNDRVGIVLNDGAGNFAQSSTIAVDEKPRGIDAADLDGDGDVDLAITTREGNTTQILRNAGNATFAVTQTLGTGQDVRYVSAGDVDGDGDVDLAVAAHDSATVRLLVNGGNGTFAPGAAFTLQRPNACLLRDLDGDGDLDLAISRGNQGVNDVTVFRNDGAGTFTQAGAFPTGLDPQEIAAFDADGDGDLDLATANAGSNDATVLENLGALAFSTAQTLAAGIEPNGATAGDFDGDGDLDLVLANESSNTLSLFDNVTAPPSFQSFGAGCPGTAGLVPVLSASGQAAAGGTVTLAITNGLPLSTALLFAGTAQAAVPVEGCTFLVGGILALQGVPLPLDGAGSISLSGTVPAVVGTVHFQAIVLDAGAANGSFAATNGLTITFG